MENSTICPHCQVTLQAEPEVGNWEEPSISDSDEVEFASSKTYTSSGLLHFQSGSVHSANVGFLWPNVMAVNTGI